MAASSGTAKLTFEGDSKDLEKAAKQAEDAVDGATKAVADSSGETAKAAKGSVDLTDKFSKLGNIVSGASDAIDGATGAMNALVDVQNAGRERAIRLARAQNDVQQALADQQQAAIDARQATEDLAQAQQDGNQAALDSVQAGLDLDQALLDHAAAQKAYNKAVKEHGKNSAEAKQADIDLRQTNIDVMQAQQDAEQATRDASQATLDQAQAVNDQKQATIDATGATLDFKEAQAEANPTDLQKAIDQMNTYAPLLNGIVGITGLITAAQWAWNAAQAASPTTWIILGIIALIAVIVLIITHLDWVKKAWKATWEAIKTAALAVGHWFRDTLWGKWIKGAWDSIVNQGVKVVLWFYKMRDQVKSVFAKIGEAVFAPFRWAFNKVADAWNNTIGRLHFSIPGIPGIFGGYSISVPNLPHFHQGGVVPGVPGSEMLAVLQAGETVTPAGGPAMMSIEIRSGGTQLDDLLVEILSRSVRRRGGNVQLVLGGRNA